MSLDILCLLTWARLNVKWNCQISTLLFLHKIQKVIQIRATRFCIGKVVLEERWVNSFTLLLIFLIIDPLYEAINHLFFSAYNDESAKVCGFREVHARGFCLSSQLFLLFPPFSTILFLAMLAQPSWVYHSSTIYLDI